MKFVQNIKLLGLACVTLLLLTQNLNGLNIRKADIEAGKILGSKVVAGSESEAERHRKKVHSESTAGQVTLGAPTFNQTNNTITLSIYSDLNKTSTNQDLNTFKLNNKKWVDNKLFSKQLDDIYHDIIYQQNEKVTPSSQKAAIVLFTSQFDLCDTNKDQVLSLKEFEGCMLTDQYLKAVVPPPLMFATFSNYTNATGFYPILFNLLDSYNVGYLNFFDYMQMRLLTFSWRKCSVLGPFIEELAFECAIEVAANWKTLSRNTNRRLYNLALELANSESNRSLDFISFFIVAQAVRAYGKINLKEDSDATKSEFNLALDANDLPVRYNQEVINHFFKLVEEHGKQNQGIDILSFVFYDFVLRIFYLPNAQVKYMLNLDEFTNGVLANYLFPQAITFEIEQLPHNNLTASAYQMYPHANISQYYQESDHFVKFLEKKVVKKEKAVKVESERRLRIKSQPVGVNASNLIENAKIIFNVIDSDSDGYISFYDFGHFIQISYLFSKFDEFSRGTVVAGKLYEKFSAYSDYPSLGVVTRDRAKKFKSIGQDVFVDVLRTVTILKIEDIVNTMVRKSDPTTLFEYELKTLFNKVHLSAIPDSALNKCLRGTDDKNVPKYEWECAFIQAVSLTANYYDWSAGYKSVKTQNLTLLNTVFVNPDPALNL